MGVRASIGKEAIRPPDGDADTDPWAQVKAGYPADSVRRFLTRVERGAHPCDWMDGGPRTDTPGATMDTPEALSFVEGLHAMKRIARPDEIAQSALYLASEMASFTTGSALYVDGGVSITRT